MSFSLQPYYDVVVIGGGAAGLMCAATAAQRGRTVLLLECTDKLGKKILMSGGGRCNFTNLNIQAEHFLSKNPHFFKSALNQYTQWDFIALVSKYKIDYHEKKHGQLFCQHSAKDIVCMLENECVLAKVTIQKKTNIESVSSMQEEHKRYKIITNHGNVLSNSIVMATGGLSIPSMGGATGFGYKVAQKFGLNVLAKNAALVPITLSGKWHDFVKRLAGVSLPVVVKTDTMSFTENILFTHRGISGPVILQLSSYWQVGQTITIDLLPSINLKDALLTAKKNTPKSLLKKQISLYLPSSLVSALENEWWLSYKDTPIAAIKSSVLEDISARFHLWTITPSGTEGYRTAEVTLGGVDTQHLSSKTMEVNTQKGLYFIGETVDVTGHLGGYNFQWAWSSGYVAGISA